MEFDRRVAEAERYVRRGIHKVALTQAQFDALVSLHQGGTKKEVIAPG
jgi:GH24 family phage-related lysozyme (muramidase)